MSDQKRKNQKINHYYLVKVKDNRLFYQLAFVSVTIAVLLLLVILFEKFNQYDVPTTTNSTNKTNIR